jgi:hypothetical protein
MLYHVRPPPRPVQGMEGIFGDIIHTVVKVAVLPITAPIEASKYLVTEGIGVVKGVAATAKEIASGLKPPPPPPPPVADYFGVGGAGGALVPAPKSSNLPLILGGVAMVALIGVALVMHKRRKGRA